MKMLVVRFGRQLAHDDPDQARQFAADAEKIAGVPGLVWKLWSYDDDAQVATSVYLFEDEESARAWGDGPMKAALSSHEGIGEIEVSYFEVDEELSAITRAPLAAQKPA